MATWGEKVRSKRYEGKGVGRYVPWEFISLFIYWLIDYYITFRGTLTQTVCAVSFSLSIHLTGESKCHRSGCWPELRLRLQQRHPAPGPWRWGLHQTGWRQSPRRQQQQIQHFLRFHPLRWLNCRARGEEEEDETEKERRRYHPSALFSIRRIILSLLPSFFFSFFFWLCLIANSSKRLSVDRGCSFCSMNHLNDKKREEKWVKKRELFFSSFFLWDFLQDFRVAEIFCLIVAYVSPSNLIFCPQIFIFKIREWSKMSVPHGEKEN